MDLQTFKKELETYPAPTIYDSFLKDMKRWHNVDEGSIGMAVIQCPGLTVSNVLRLMFPCNPLVDLTTSNYWKFVADTLDTSLNQKSVAVLESQPVALNDHVVCECGAEKCRTSHANWCPMYKEP